MEPRSRRLLVAAVFVVAIMISFSIYEIILSEPPEFSVYNNQSKVSASGNFINYTSLSPTIPSVASVSQINESGQPTSYLSLELGPIGIFYDPGGHAIMLSFHTTIAGNISSNIHPSGLQFQATDRYQGSGNVPQGFLFVNPSSKDNWNLSIGNAQNNYNATSFWTPFEFLNQPSRSILGGYSVDRYTFGYTTGLVIIEFSPAVGLRTFNLSAELTGLDKPVFASVEIALDES